ncbi:MAG TPA: 4-oxalocrotonate decarboxylase [Myxococcales bacterium]|nr:4-oxalocrotonate decarboxylase [Myxococcales bacterium]HAN32365.1 4-oxalocrotonate decarboxylase [Myxococcales bacterium]
MSESNAELERFAEVLDRAATSATAVAQLTVENPQLSLAQGYTIQRLLVGHRLARGASRSGMKMGLTSLAKMEQGGVHEPIYAHLTSDMVLSDGGTLPTERYLHPRAEPEIAFILAKDLNGVVTEAQAAAAVAGVCPAIEVIDSRYKDFKFQLVDVVADNASSCRFVMGPTLTPLSALMDYGADLGNLGMVFEVNGKVVHTGSSAAILEHPLRSLTTLVRMLSERGEGLLAGDVVLAGAATPAVHLQPGQHVKLFVDGLGSAELFAS